MTRDAKPGSICDGFILVAAGDCIVTKPISDAPGFAPVQRLLQSADIAFANLESSLLDRSQITQAPPDEVGTAWAIGSPLVAKDLRTMGLHVVSKSNNHAVDFGLDGGIPTRLV